MRHLWVSTRFGELELAAEAGGDDCRNLPVRRKRKARTMFDVNEKKSSKLARKVRRADKTNSKACKYKYCLS